MVFLGNAVAAVHVAGEPRDVERLAAIVALHQRDRWRRGFTGFQHASEAQRTLQAERNLGLHVGELLLHQLIGGERTAKLLAIEHILTRAMPAKFSGAHRAPRDSVARVVETPERTGKALHIRQQVFFRHHAVFQHDLAGDRGPQRQFAFDLRRGESLASALDQKAANDIVELCPHHRNMRDRCIGDPGLGAVEFIAAGNFLGARDHRTRVGTVIGFGQAEAADSLAGRKLRQIFATLRLGAIGVDRIHHQRRLHRH